jgi:PAS domain S-box-containing protein
VGGARRADEQCVDLTRARDGLARDLQQEIAKRQTLELQLADDDAAVEYLEEQTSIERRAVQEHVARLEAAAAQTAAARLTLEGRLTQEAAERQALETRLAQDTAARQTLEEQLATQAAERQTLEGRLAQEAAERQALEHISGEQLEVAAASLAATRAERDALRQEADRIPQLRGRLEESHAENRRRFEHAPYGICGCTRDGRLERGNRAMARLLGYRGPDELRTIDLATRVFESEAELRFLVDRCLETRKTESLEVKWRRKDGRPLTVRLSAVAVTQESIEIMVEDLTALRAVEERLRQAQRMEAVGRLASEVSATCDHLLRDVRRDCQHWLDAAGPGTIVRHQGELLMDDVNRAADLLQQLTVYGRQQERASEPVSVGHVLRDMAPVLKRLAGDEVEFVLPKGKSRITVDVEAQRLERMLVNVAHYARQRMPSGGRLKIDLSSVVVDRTFVAKYPSVRPGAHALITITEIKESARSVPGIDRPTDVSEARATEPASDKAGVNVGALLEIVRNSGGHLWMAVEPTGNMVLKIHLPRPAPTDASGLPLPRLRRRRAIARWLGH